MAKSFTTVCALLTLTALPALAAMEAQTAAPPPAQDSAAAGPSEKEVPPMDADTESGAPQDDCCDVTPPKDQSK